MIKGTNDQDGSPGYRALVVPAAVAALMVLPVVAIRAAEDAAWEVGDAVFLCILVALFTAAYALAARANERSAYALGVCIALAAGFGQAWINLAVGVIGSENNPANLMYAGVVGLAAFGALLARFRAAGMSVVMTAAAIAQALTFVAALVAGLGFTGPITVLFTGLWLLSAWLFRKAAQPSASAESARQG